MSNNTDNNYNHATIAQIESLEDCRRQVDNRIRELTAQRDQLAQQESALRNYLVAAGALPQEFKGDSDLSVDINHQTSPEMKGWMRHRRDAELADLVFHILDKRNGHQMHYKEIVQEVAETGWPFTDNQASREAWVNRVLNRDGRFIRPSKRGWYSLKKYYPNVTRSIGERQRITH